MSNDEIPEGFNMTELGALPEGWGAKTLVDIATLQRGKDLPKQNQIPGPYPIVGSSGIIGCHNRCVCAGPGVITGRSGSIGKLIYVEKDYWPHNTCLYVKDFHANNPKFIYYLLHLLDFKKYATGVSVPTLNRNSIHSALLPLPPLPEQHRIAAVLSAVQDAKEKTEVVIAAAKSLKKSLMRHLFTYGPVSAGAAESVPLKETEIGRVPEGWGVVQLQDQINIIDCKHITPKYVRLGIPLIRPRNIKDGEIDYSDIEYISEEQYKFFTEKHAPEQGDILFSRNASYGNPAYVKTKQKLCIGQDMVVMTHRCANTLYIFYLLCSNLLLAQINLLSTGSTIHRINLKDIRRLLIPLPPLPTQQKIASILSTIDRKIEAEENKKIALDELFKSLLHNLMTGKVRVNHLEMPQ